jgi:uncharacterized protein YaaW (UPF0174 family)
MDKREEILEQVNNNVWNHIGKQSWNQFWEQVNKQVEEQVNKQVEYLVRNSVCFRVEILFKQAVMDQVFNQVIQELKNG